jgi:hypothetical protein
MVKHGAGGVKLFLCDMRGATCASFAGAAADLGQALE